MSKLNDYVIENGLEISCTVMKYRGKGVNVRMPEGVTSVDSWAFWNGEDNNNTIKRIYIPKTMTVIEPMLFSRCFCLEELFIPATVTEIQKSNISFQNFWLNKYRPFKRIYVEPGSYAEEFAKAEKIPYKYMDESTIEWDNEPEENWTVNCVLDSYTGEECNVIIPEDITHIGYGAFENNNIVKTITLPETLEKIDGYAFSGCSNLTEIIGLEKTKLTCISNDTFRDAKHLKTVKLPPVVQKIGAGAFYGCSDLVNIELPESLVEIGASAFYGCVSLKEIIIPYGCKNIDNYAFDWTDALTKIVIPRTVEQIGVNVFSGHNKSLCIWGEAGSYIASKMQISEHKFQLMDEKGQPIDNPENTYDERYQQYVDYLQKASKELGEPTYCYVQDMDMKGYYVTESSDFEAAEKALSKLFSMKPVWEKIKKSGSINSLFEYYALNAIATAIAIKVYICPDVDISFGFETSKWSGGESALWWTISPVEESGRFFEDFDDFVNRKPLQEHI